MMQKGIIAIGRLKAGIYCTFFYNNNMQIRQMHELSMRESIAAKKWKFQQLFKGLKIERILAHELKMRFKLLNFARKLFLKLLKNTLPPCSGKFILTKYFG